MNTQSLRSQLKKKILHKANEALEINLKYLKGGVTDFEVNLKYYE